MKIARIGQGGRWALAVVAIWLPLAMGGCPDVRTGVLDALQSATVAVASESAENGAAGVLQRGLASTLAEALFGRLRNEPIR